MKPLQQNEVYEHLSGFLKAKGIELTQGTYSSAIQKSCSFLTDAINLGQRGFKKVATEVDTKLDQMRQVIHEKTAPKPPKTATAPAHPGAPKPKASKTAAADPPTPRGPSKKSSAQVKKAHGRQARRKR